MKTFENFIGGRTHLTILVIIFALIIANLVITEIENFTISPLMTLGKVLFVSTIVLAISIVILRIITLVKIRKEPKQ